MNRAYFLEWIIKTDVLEKLLKQLIKTYRNVNRINLLNCISASDGDFINGVVNLLNSCGQEYLREWYVNDMNIDEIIEINEHVINALKMLKKGAK